MKNNSGFTIVEILVAVAVISVVFTSLISIAATSLRNSNVNIRKTIGAHMADGLQEWIRWKKEDDWNDFVTRQGTWCFNTDPIGDNWPSASANGACAGFASKNNFRYKRQVIISTSGDVISSRVDYFWDDTNLNNKVINETYYSQW